jgi:hypothetical protein
MYSRITSILIDAMQRAIPTKNEMDCPPAELAEVKFIQTQ